MLGANFDTSSPKNNYTRPYIQEYNEEEKKQARVEIVPEILAVAADNRMNKERSPVYKNNITVQNITIQ